MRTVHLAAVLASAMVLSTPASAGFFDFTLAPYIGASAGQSQFDDDECPSGFSCDDTDSAWKVYGGLEMNEYISMEVGYLELGETTATDNAGGSAKFRTNGATVQMVGTFALNPKFTLLGKGGFGILHSEVDVTDGVTAENVQDTDLEWSLGLGAQYNFTKSLGMRAEWERYFNVGDRDETGDLNIDLITLGLVLKF